MGGNKSREGDPYANFRELISPSTIRHSQLYHIASVQNSTSSESPAGPFGDVGCVVSLSIGATHCLAVVAGGTVYAWGSNKYGQLGDGRVAQTQRSHTAVPEAVYFPKTFANVVIERVAAGFGHSAAVTEDGMLLTWGLGSEGQLGYEGKVKIVREGKQLLPREVAGMNDERAEDVVCGKDFTAVLTESGSIVTFGCGKDGALGQDAIGSSSRPMTLRGVDSQTYAGVRFVKVRAGWAHCLALTDSGALYYWGNQYHARGRKEDVRKAPLRVDGLARVTVCDFACGYDHSAVLARAEFNASRCHVFTWGCNEKGQLGYMCADNTQYAPGEVPVSGEGVVDIGAGRHYTALLRDSGELLCWGDNPKGPFSHSGALASPTVVYSSAEEKVSALACGFDSVYLLREADYSYSVATLLNCPEADEDSPQRFHQRTVSHHLGT